MITKWLRDSGLVVNESKTEVCLFHNEDQPLINIIIMGVSVRSTKSINVLGDIYDSKLNWNIHVAKTIAKAKRSLFGLKLLKKYFNNQEMRRLLDSHFNYISFERLHVIHKKCTPSQISMYQQSIWLYKILNFDDQNPALKQ